MTLLVAVSARLLGLPPMGAFWVALADRPKHGLARRAEISAEPLRAGLWWRD